MRILHFYKTYYTPEAFGGVEQVICQLCRGAAKCGITNSRYCPWPFMDVVLFDDAGTRRHAGHRHAHTQGVVGHAHFAAEQLAQGRDGRQFRRLVAQLASKRSDAW